MTKNEAEEKEVKVLAEGMHNFYEITSQKVGWKTQKKCRVRFDELPEENKRVMLALAKYVTTIFQNKHEQEVAELKKKIENLNLNREVRE